MMRPQIQDILHHNDLFRGLGEDSIDEIADLCQLRSYFAGEHVFQQGCMGARLYIVAGGQVILERSMDLGKRAGKVIVETLGKGKAFGCWSTLLDAPHTMLCSAICIKPGNIVRFKGEELRALMQAQPTLGYRVMENLCMILRDRVQAIYGAFEKI